MAIKKNIVMFWFMNDWGKYGRTYENIAKHVSVNPEVGRVVCLLPPEHVSSDRYSWPLRFSHVGSKLVVVNLATRVVPTHRAPFSLRSWLNENLPNLSFRALLKLLGFNEINTTLWLFPPHAYIKDVLACVPHSHLVVQVIDNNSLINGVSEGRKSVNKAQYESLASMAEVVIVSSDRNYQIFSCLNSNCVKHENAVDDIFLSRPALIPSVTSGARPRLGYVGWITERTDLALIEQLAKKRPDYDIVLAGPLDETDPVDMGGLEDLPNVKWIGPIAYGEVPAFLRTLDVCLIPHKDNDYTRTMSPLKLFQYLGSGRPIVSTRIAGVDQWSQYVYISEAYDSFIENVDVALHEDSLDKSRARILSVAAHTWSSRVTQILGDVFRPASAHRSPPTS